LKVDEALAGRRVKCPRCGEPIVVPAASAAPKQTAALTPAEILREEGEGPVLLKNKKFAGDEEMDMTPMVDMTFLLLIFFICTSTFNLQKSIDMPVPDQKEGVSQNVTLEEIEEDDTFVIVRIEADNTIWVEDTPVYSETELVTRLRDLREGGNGAKGATSMLVMASGEARHETVVRVLDTGSEVRMESVRLSNLEDEDL
jgi:biopolymer transport protein ExbD